MVWGVVRDRARRRASGTVGLAVGFGYRLASSMEAWVPHTYILPAGGGAVAGGPGWG